MADTESSLVGAGPAQDVYDEGGSGWLTFAGVMILVVRKQPAL